MAPCYDSRDDRQDEIDRLNGIICALTNELERRGILVDVVAEAQRHGKIDIFKHIKNYKKYNSNH